jgi:hypothetical protein
LSIIEGSKMKSQVRSQQFSISRSSTMRTAFTQGRVWDRRGRRAFRAPPNPEALLQAVRPSQGRVPFKAYNPWVSPTATQGAPLRGAGQAES